MKKALVLLMMIALVSTLGTVFAADTAAASNRSAGLYNGITYFDSWQESTMPGTIVTVEPTDTPYNGITAFELGQPGTSKRDYAVWGAAAGGQRPEEKLYNGITVF